MKPVHIAQVSYFVHFTQLYPYKGQNIKAVNRVSEITPGHLLKLIIYHENQAIPDIAGLTHHSAYPLFREFCLNNFNMCTAILVPIW